MPLTKTTAPPRPPATTRPARIAAGLRWPGPVRAGLLRAVTLAAFCALAAPGAAQQQGHYIAEPSAAQLAAADVLLVDIRQPGEWLETGVLPQALLIAHDGDHARFMAALAPHLDGRPVALICRTGNRTAQAAAALAPALEVPVIDIAGGMVRLMAEGTPTTAPTRARGCALC